MANPSTPIVILGDSVLVNHRALGLVKAPAFVTAINPDGSINVTAVDPRVGICPIESIRQASGTSDGWITKEQASGIVAAENQQQGLPPNARTAPVSSTPATTGTPTTTQPK